MLSSIISTIFTYCPLLRIYLEFYNFLFVESDPFSFICYLSYCKCVSTQKGLRINRVHGWPDSSVAYFTIDSMFSTQKSDQFHNSLFINDLLQPDGCQLLSSSHTKSDTSHKSNVHCAPIYISDYVRRPCARGNSCQLHRIIRQHQRNDKRQSKFSDGHFTQFRTFVEGTI